MSIILQFLLDKKNKDKLINALICAMTVRKKESYVRFDRKNSSTNVTKFIVYRYYPLI